MNHIFGVPFTVRQTVGAIYWKIDLQSAPNFNVVEERVCILSTATYLGDMSKASLLYGNATWQILVDTEIRLAASKADL